MKRMWICFGVLALAAAVVFYPTWERWEAHATGSYNCPPGGCVGGVAHNYNFFSGWGSDWIPSVISVLGIALLAWWHTQCHVSGCFWPTRKTTAAGDRACWLHHPHRGIEMTKELLHHRHRTATPEQVTVVPPNAEQEKGM